jgi:hypothetical protein
LKLITVNLNTAIFSFYKQSLLSCFADFFASSVEERDSRRRDEERRGERTRDNVDLVLFFTGFLKGVKSS